MNAHTSHYRSMGLAIKAKQQRGFTLVELMVAMVITLLISIAALGSAKFFMASQRQAIGVSGASGEGTTAMAAIKDELAQAGLGFYSKGSLLCPRLNVASSKGVFANNQAQMPTSLQADGFNTQIDVLYADNSASAAPALTATDTLLSSAGVTLNSYLPSQVGQEVLLAPPSGVDAPCTVQTITDFAAPTNLTQQTLGFGSSGEFNKTPFADISYPQGTRVGLLGALIWRRFHVVDGNLQMDNVLDGTSAVIAQNVVALTAQYGVTAAGDSSLQGWQDPTGAWSTLTGAQLSQVSALRVGVVLRSAQGDKPDASGNCTSTLSPPSYLDKAVTVQALADSAARAGTLSWQCYRYRATTITVPLRNRLNA